jgi:hypothetical protein
MYNIITSNRAEKWTSQSRNTNFRSVFTMNRCFMVQTKVGLFNLEVKFYIFNTTKILCT